MNRYQKSVLKRSAWYVRGGFKHLLNRPGTVQNIYHACIQKTGSQWVKSVFNDPEIIRKTGMQIHPQFRYEIGEFKREFPYYTFVPGLYIPYPLYNEIKKPERYKTFYVIRDPRDIVVSWYYSAKYTHGLMGMVPEHRRKLRQIDEEEGITYCINHLQWKFSFIRTWWYNREDPHVYIVRFEELINKPVFEWRKIFNHCEIQIGEDTLERVLNRHTKEKMRKRDLRRRKGTRSHYRKDKKGWQDLFEKHHVELFSRVNGDLVEELGYE